MTHPKFLRRMVLSTIVITLLVSCVPGPAQPAAAPAATALPTVTASLAATATAAPTQISVPTAVPPTAALPTVAPMPAPPTGTPPVVVQLKQGGVLITPDNAADVKLLRTIEEYQGQVWNVAFSANGMYISSTDRDRISIRDAASGQEAFALSSQRLDMNGLAFSPDSRLLASGQTIWDVKSRQALHMLDEHGYSHPAFSPDGAWLAVSGDHPITLWRVASRQLVRAFEAQADNVSFSIAFSPDGTLLADGGHPGRIRLWDVASGKVARTFTQDVEKDIHDVAFSPDGKWLASVSIDSTVRLWDVASGKQVHTMRHSDGLYGVTFSPDGRLVASASCDRTVKLWDVASGKMLIFLRHGDEVTSVAFSPDGTLLASGAYDSKVYLWGIPR